MNDTTVFYAIIVSTLAMLLLLAGVILSVTISNKKLVKQEVKIAQMERDYEIEMRKVQDEVQEQVLTNVARELHDNIGQLMTVMHVQLEQKKITDPRLATLLAPFHDTLRKATQEVRTLGKSLNSDLLEQNGLLQTISTEAARLAQLGQFAVIWTNDDTEPALEKDQRLMVFRIFQEVINNVLKHSQANKVEIYLSGKKFGLTITDDGVGFNAAEMLQSGNGSGLKNMARRASLASLNCHIQSQAGNGSHFSLTGI